MSIRLIIVSLAWAALLIVTVMNVLKPFVGLADVAIWFSYLGILTAVILWPRTDMGDRVEESGDAWSQAAE
ncbi:MAG: hypothetical protein AAFR70_04405 [Pseudomonadota bacterium]